MESNAQPRQSIKQHTGLGITFPVKANQNEEDQVDKAGCYQDTVPGGTVSTRRNHSYGTENRN